MCLHGCVRCACMCACVCLSECVCTIKRTLQWCQRVAEIAQTGMLAWTHVRCSRVCACVRMHACAYLYVYAQSHMHTHCRVPASGRDRTTGVCLHGHASTCVHACVSAHVCMCVGTNTHLRELGGAEVLRLSLSAPLPHPVCEAHPEIFVVDYSVRRTRFG